MATTTKPKPGSTAERVLDVAERLVQTRGFNGFSYADIATELGVTKASLHYHFASKAELGEALIRRYAQRFGAALAEIDRSITSPSAKLDAYVELYAEVLRGERMCLCGILAAEYQTLAEPMREAVIAFFDANEAWLTDVLVCGAQDGTVVCVSAPSDAAKMMLCGLEGAMLVARPYGDVDRFRSAASCLLAGLLRRPS